MKTSEDTDPDSTPTRAMDARAITVHPVLKCGLARRCPRCAEGRVFERWNSLSTQCAVCGCALKRREGDCWFFMYMTTGFFTGLMIAVMFVLTPANVLLGQIAVGSIGLTLIVVTLPVRKSLAIALDFFLEERKRGWLLYGERSEA